MLGREVDHPMPSNVKPLRAMSEGGSQAPPCSTSFAALGGLGRSTSSLTFLVPPLRPVAVALARAMGRAQSCSRYLTASRCRTRPAQPHSALADIAPGQSDSDRSRRPLWSLLGESHLVHVSVCALWGSGFQPSSDVALFWFKLHHESPCLARCSPRPAQSRSRA